MDEYFLLNFRRVKAGIFELRGCQLLAFGTSPATDQSDSQSVPSEFAFQRNRHSRALPFVLALIRIAQWHRALFVDPGSTMTVFRSETGGGIVERFADAFHDATSRKADDAKACRWLLRMFSLPQEEPHQAQTRLKRCFEISMRPPPSTVSCHLNALPAESIVILVDGERVEDRMLDNLEAYLSFQAKAGVPFHYEMNGLVSAGRPPTVSPEFHGREDECVLLDRALARKQNRILSIVGGRGSGKSVLAMHWLRRCIGLKTISQRLVFFWTVPNQAEKEFVPFPTIEFFAELASQLGFKIGARSSADDKANSVLEAMRAHPTLVYLDGVEAMVGRRVTGSQTATHEMRFEFDPGIALLLRGIAEGRGGDSTVLLTSQIDMEPVLGVKSTFVTLRELEWDILREIHDLYLFDNDVIKITEADNSRKGLLVNLHRSLDGLRPQGMSTTEYVDRVKQEIALMPPKKLFASVPVTEPSENEKLLANMRLRALEGKPELVLFYIVCCGIEAVGEPDLLQAARMLFDGVQQQRKETGKVPKDLFFNTLGMLETQDWGQVLDRLLATNFLLETARSERYSVHPSDQQYVAAGLEHLMPLAWTRIHQVLAEILEAQVPWRPDSQRECSVLARAAIHRCHAGERRYAYEVLCYDRLSRNLKAYVIFHVGDYSSPKTVMSALFGGVGNAAVSSLTKEQEAMCVHVLGLCCRYDNDLEAAREHEEDAWNRAKLIGSTIAASCAGVNLIRICHIFGDLRRAKEVESKLYLMMMKEKIFALFGRQTVIPRENIADGAGFMTALLALSHVYREPQRLRTINFLLQAGIKQCREVGEKFEVLMPSFGRPWHALVLLESGRLDLCEVAMESGEWTTDMLRYQQTGIFELLTAKYRLAKALTLKGSQRETHLQAGLTTVLELLDKVTTGRFTWWRNYSTLIQGRLLTELGQLEAANAALQEAKALSEEGRFQLLHVDTLLAQAQAMSWQKNQSAARKFAESALHAAKKLDYGLHDATLQDILKRKSGK